jgi:hypothetical protein
MVLHEGVYKIEGERRRSQRSQDKADEHVVSTNDLADLNAAVAPSLLAWR